MRYWRRALGSIKRSFKLTENFGCERFRIFICDVDGGEPTWKKGNGTVVQTLVGLNSEQPGF